MHGVEVGGSGDRVGHPPRPLQIVQGPRGRSGLAFGFQWFLLPIGLLLGVLVAFIIFGRRVQKSVYKKADGQAGAAAWALDNLQGSWRVTNAIAGTTHLDAVT
ncbi:DUF4191 family protein, partial [Rhodococcus sp. 05-2254-6]|uniref:DUF4191 family protein n=1 Tax=Rhodococcus sp. 05-2254-6 TaxID=2022489 RepID=UPI00359428A7